MQPLAGHWMYVTSLLTGVWWVGFRNKLIGPLSHHFLLLSRQVSPLCPMTQVRQIK